MGASSSSAFWDHSSFDHGSKELSVCYETMINDVTVMKDMKFLLKDCLEIAKNKSDLFPDITLVLDIDLTLGEALVIKYDPEKGFLLDGSLIDFSHIDRLKNHGYCEWFHNGVFLFFLRPYFGEFISFCIRNFKEVVIWTNGVQQHADDMIRSRKDLDGR